MTEALNGRSRRAPRGRTAPIDESAVRLAQSVQLSPRAERDAVRVLECAADLTRINIVRALMETPLAASDLARIVGRSAAATSQHMRVLREVGAVIPTRSGNVIRYRLSKEPSAVLLETIAGAFDLLNKRE
ncbi:MAG TPA: metalloregulator ArsR/SmtB family transcription factor [Candidatus Limnocylindria bacterium]|jgi:DNA-binding transcriptional ArsR family regulator|nr:metalloregulator ArsR/SmtB family transcription factor [Candidatus Limnocylindria bacterium]